MRSEISLIVDGKIGVVEVAFVLTYSASPPSWGTLEVMLFLRPSGGRGGRYRPKMLRKNGQVVPVKNTKLII